MERFISDEERIRRAELVAEKRKNFEVINNDEKKTCSKGNLFLIQCLICLVIYGGFYCIKNNKADSCVHIKELLNYDTDFRGLYDRCTQMIKSKNEERPANKDNAENVTEEISVTEVPGIGGELCSEEEIVNESVDQMSVDADYVVKKIALVNPLECGIVTSRFGERESSNIVSKNHRGIDIGAKNGTDSASATDGTVLEVSSVGDFGKHIKIRAEDIVFIYAHCSKIMVNKGDYVKKGQKIAEVGSTGKATGPHLHFEVRRENRAINPDLLLEFS